MSDPSLGKHWWGVGAAGTTATGTSTFWFPAFGTYTGTQKKYPNALVGPFPFKTKKAAQVWCNQQNGVSGTKPGSGGGKGGKGKGTHGTQNNKPTGAAIVADARSWLGVPYVFGGTSRRGVDCSGLVMNVAHEVGIQSCPRTSEEQWAWCEKISQTDAGPGDLVFFVGAPEETGTPGHVGIIISPGQMINAPFPGTTVRIDHFTQGEPDQNTSNPNALWGYGRMRGAAKSSSANPYVGGGGGGLASAAGATIGGTVMPVIVVIGIAIIVVILFMLFIGAGLLWRAK